MPAQLHINLLVLFKAGLLRIITIGEPGPHGPAMAGIQGCGVNTPSAAVVAAATCGLASEEQTPKGITFFIGMLSMIIAADLPVALTIFSGVTVNELGAAPKEHCSIAPIQTN